MKKIWRKQESESQRDGQKTGLKGERNRTGTGGEKVEAERWREEPK